MAQNPIFVETENQQNPVYVDNLNDNLTILYNSIGTLIATLQSYVSNGSGSKAPTNQSLVDLLSTLKSYVTNGSGGVAPTNKSIVDLLATLQTTLNTLETYVFNGSGATVATNKSLADLINAVNTILTNGTYGLSAMEVLIASIITNLSAWLNNSGTVLPANTSLYDSVTYQLQPAANLTQITPSQNTYYNILSTTSNVIPIGIYVAVASTGETLQVKVILDGITFLSATFAATAGTTYFVYMNGNSLFYQTLTSGTTATYFYGGTSGLLMPAYRSVSVSVQKTTASGTGTLTGSVFYSKR